MSVISSLILQRLAPAITAFVLFLNSVAGLFGAAPVIPYNPERTDVVVSGEVTTDVNEILGYYNAAVKKTNKSFVIGSSSSKVNGTPEIVMDEETVSEITNELMKTYWTTLEATSSTVFKVPGEGNVIAADVESAKMSVKDGKRYEGWPAIIRAVNTTDAMSATIEEIPYPILHHITDRITHEVPGINRVLLDLTPKPIGTIEWE